MTAGSHLSLFGWPRASGLTSTSVQYFTKNKCSTYGTATVVSYRTREFQHTYIYVTYERCKNQILWTGVANSPP